MQSVHLIPPTPCVLANAQTLEDIIKGTAFLKVYCTVSRSTFVLRPFLNLKWNAAQNRIILKYKIIFCEKWSQAYIWESNKLKLSVQNICLSLETDSCLKVAYLRSVSLFPLFLPCGKAGQNFIWKKRKRKQEKKTQCCHFSSKSIDKDWVWNLYPISSWIISVQYIWLKIQQM